MPHLRTSFWALIPFFLFALVTGQKEPVQDDIHGGVTMGVSSEVCDDAKAHIEIDWDPNSTEEYTCTDDLYKMSPAGLHYSHCDKIAMRPLHICYSRVINYKEDIPTSGSHRPLWPQYGEYRYVPRQRWLHNLEHGGIVFLYHPCADPTKIQLFKSIAERCLWKHIISPYKKMPPNMNFAVLAWKCKLLLSDVDVSQIVRFIKTRALNGPEQTIRDGQYSIGLIKEAKIVSDKYDSELCPSMSVMSATTYNFKDRSSERKKKSQFSLNNFQRILSDALDELQHYRI